MDNIKLLIERRKKILFRYIINIYLLIEGKKSSY